MFLSGQLSVNESGKYVPQSAINKGKLAFSNVFSALENAGFKKEDLVFIDIAFNDLNNLAVIDMVYKKHFKEGK